MKRTLLIVGAVALVGVLGTAQAAGDAAAGKAKSATCAGCHGANGEGKGSFPALAGMKEKEIISMLKDYKSGKKNNAMMKSFAEKLSDQDMANLAAYYSSLKKK